MTARPSIRRTVAAALLGALLLLAVPAAQAAPYAVDFCRNWDTDAPAAVLPGLAPSPGTQLGVSCADSSTISATALPGENEPGAILSVPADRPGLRIVRVWTSYAASYPGTLPAGATAIVKLLAGTALIRQDSIVPGAARSDDHALPPGTRELQWRTDLTCSTDRGTARAAAAPDCATPSCSDRATLRAAGETRDVAAAAAVCPASLTLVKNRLFLDESVAPALSGVGGTLFSAGGQGGRRTVTFNAADADSGVAEVTVKIGGTVVGSATYPCPATDWSACARERPGQTIEVDTALAGGASQPVTLTARDFAGNAITVAAAGAGVDGPPGAVTISDPTGGKTGPNGENATSAARISAAFKGTKKRTRSLSFGARPTVAGTLLTTAGAPIRGATIAVRERPRKAGGTWRQIGTAETSATGAFSFRVPGGPSRTLSFEYTANSADARPATTSRLSTRVRGSVSAGGSRRSVRVGAPFVISGRLKLLPRRGVQVTIQGYNRRRWQVIGQAKTDVDGKYRWTYRFTAAGAFKTFAFRARVDSPIYPFAAASSGRVIVSVRR